MLDFVLKSTQQPKGAWEMKKNEKTRKTKKRNNTVKKVDFKNLVKDLTDEELRQVEEWVNNHKWYNDIINLFLLFVKRTRHKRVKKLIRFAVSL